ncbi:MAG: family peptidase [Oscillospiraceae bacterium]|nr:family peptidase [Oscillospiraceae bacterium]
MIKHNAIELLAPAGQPDCITAAVRCGADAIYLGQKQFSARSSAHNFDEEEFCAAVKYCHERGVKVYQTLNTLAFDEELEQIKNYIKIAAQCGVDALIVQDLGIAELVKKTCPSMRLHASTQMTVHSPDGAKLMEFLGFKRVVLAREMSLKEIEDVAKATSLELEIFVHGALCMSVSGQCYFSAMLGSRSGNRGQCAQPCRLPFSSTDKPANDLSLKDLCAVDVMDELLKIGIKSIKIEGRMKRPEYVAAAVSSYRNALDKKQVDTDALRAVFSRSGFTNGYLEDNRSPDMFGTRQKEDVVSANSVFKSIQNTYKSETPRIALEFEFRLKKGEKAQLCVTDSDGNQAVAMGSEPQQAISKSTTKESAQASLSKLGGTPFWLAKFDTDIDDGIMVPVSELNALRRECCDKILQIRGETKPKEFLDFAFQKSERKINSTPNLRARFADIKQINFENINYLDKIILPLHQIEKNPNELESIKAKCIIELPRVVFRQEESMKKRVESLYNQGFKCVMAQNISQVNFAKQNGWACVGGFGLNVTNSMSAIKLEEFGLSDVTCSVELKLSQAKKLCTAVPIGVMAYGYLPLMLTRNCPIKNQKSCLDCAKQSALVDRRGSVFRVACAEGYSEVLNSEVLYMADRLEELSMFDFMTLYFTVESKAECQRVIENYVNGYRKPQHFTRGLLYRGVL